MLKKEIMSKTLEHRSVKSKPVFISDSSSEDELLKVPCYSEKNGNLDHKNIAEIDCSDQIYKKKLPSPLDVNEKQSNLPNQKQKDAEKAKRKAAQAELKTLKPEESLKQMICLIDTSIEAMIDCGSLVQQLSDETEVTYNVLDSGSGYPSIKWQRKVELYDTNENASIIQTNDIQDEPLVLLVLQSTDLLKLASNDTSSDSLSCSEWMNNLKQAFPSLNIHIACFGIKKYKRQIKNKAQQQFRQQVLERSEMIKPKKRKKGNIELSNSQIEEILVDLQLVLNINVIFVESAEELLILIQQITKSVAEAPYKRMKRNNIQFVNEKASVKVDALTGQGSTKVWKQMLLQMHNLSPDMADAIIKMYPTIHALMSAYQGCSCKDGENLLADIVIRRGFGTLLNNRKIGPELSKRIYKMMTCQNGSEIL